MASIWEVCPKLDSIHGSDCIELAVRIDRGRHCPIGMVGYPNVSVPKEALQRFVATVVLLAQAKGDAKWAYLGWAIHAALEK